MNAPIVDLPTLLERMQPRLHEQTYAYVRLPSAEHAAALGQWLALLCENEGYSAVIETAVAERSGLAFEGPFALITLQVHSSLNAVGLTAAVATALANSGISANMIAAYHHDYVLLPVNEGERAIAVLEQLSQNG